MSKQAPIDVILNCILVNENIRPAMLVQPQDYDEETGEDSKTKSILQEIKIIFPELIQSENYETYQGIIVSKTDYNGQTISLNDMGKVLGYPCYQDFEDLDRNKTTYGIHINIIFKSGEKIQLLANICKDETKNNIFNDLAAKAKNAFKNPKYEYLLKGFEVENVEVTIKSIIPIQELINNLIKNKTMNKQEMDVFKDHLENSGFTDSLVNYDFQLYNQIHQGIILTLLSKYKNDILSPFYPLQGYHGKLEEVDEITKNLETDLLNILNETRINHQGGKKRITKRRRFKKRHSKKTRRY